MTNVIFDDSLHRDKTLQRKFREMQVQFISTLNKYSGSTGKYGFLHATPLIVSRDSNDNFRRVYEILMRAIREIVLNYENDSDIQKIIPLSSKERELISCCDFPYEMGTLRPDFLIDQDMQFKINEINARFPLNGYFISYHMNNALRNVREFQQMNLIPELEEIPFQFKRLNDSITTIKRKEADWDILFFCQSVIRAGGEFYHYYPEQLELKGKGERGKLSVKGRELDSIVLEVTQQELLDNFSKDKVRSLRNHPHLNDIRTILLGHDKRLLAVLYNEDILLRYINRQEQEVLKSHLIETYSVDNPKNFEEIIRNKDDWVLKPALKGKMEDLYIGDKSSERGWRSAWEKTTKEPFVVQRKVNEYQFSVYMPHLKEIKIPLSGMLLGIDGRFISQGVYRGIFQDPTSLWDGHLFIAPALS